MSFCIGGPTSPTWAFSTADAYNAVPGVAGFELSGGMPERCESFVVPAHSNSDRLSLQMDFVSVQEGKGAPNPSVAQMGLLLNENISMYADPDITTITLHLTWVSA